MKNAKEILLDLDQIISSNTKSSMKIEDEREAAEKLLLRPNKQENLVQQVFSKHTLPQQKDKQ